MKKETRANLIFLALFLAISLPGGVILFKKKLDPSRPVSYLPDAMRRTLPYMAPLDRPDVQRFVPEKTGAWLAGQATARGFAEVLMRDGSPVLSADRRVQVVGLTGVKVGLLIWDGDALGPVGVAGGSHGGARGGGEGGGSGEVGGDAGGSAGGGKGVEIEHLNLPEEVLKELKYAGFTRPPTRVLWATAPRPVPSTSLEITYQSGRSPMHTSVPPFTN